MTEDEALDQELEDLRLEAELQSLRKEAAAKEDESFSPLDYVKRTVAGVPQIVQDYAAPFVTPIRKAGYATAAALSSGFDKDEYNRTFQEMARRDQEDMERARNETPELPKKAAQAFGLMAGMGLGGPVGAAGEMATGLIPAAKRIAGMGALGAAERGLSNPNPNTFWDSEEAQQGAGIAGGLTAAIEGYTGMRGLAKDYNLGRKALAAYGGVPEQVLEAYQANPERINAARSFPNQELDVTQRIRGLKKQVIQGSEEATALIPDDGIIPADEIQSGFKNILDRFEGAGGAGQAAHQAKGSMQSLYGDFNKRVAQPLPVAEENALAPTVKLLDQYGYELPSSLPPVVSYEGQEVALRDIKTFIKNLDKEIKVSKRLGTFASPEMQAKVDLRKNVLDKVLKENVPEYANAMRGVADDARALEMISENFGTKNQGQKLVTAARRETQTAQREALGELSKRTSGPDILQEAQDRLNLEAFTKDATRGSKGVNLMTGAISALGAGVGALTGSTALSTAIGAASGGGLGGTLGAMRDSYGPKMTKAFLDRQIRRQSELANPKGFVDVFRTKASQATQPYREALSGSIRRGNAAFTASRPDVFMGSGSTTKTYDDAEADYYRRQLQTNQP